MITCPDCHAENEAGAKECQSCGRALPQPEAAGAALPQWLQQLKPENEEDTLLEAVAAPSKSATASGTDGLFSAQPPKAAGRGKKSAGKRDLPEQDAAKGAQMTETASLISEDDLPSWLRAFGDAEKNKDTAPSDESWMVGAETDTAADVAATQNLAQSWQAPARSVEARSRTGAASVFAKPAEGVAKPERVIATPVAVVPEPEPEPIARPSGARTEMPRPAPTPRKEGLPLQRVAMVAFVAALLIFLVVVGIFLIGPKIG